MFHRRKNHKQVKPHDGAQMKTELRFLWWSILLTWSRRVKTDLRYTSFDFSGHGRNPIFMWIKKKNIATKWDLKFQSEYFKCVAQIPQTTGCHVKSALIPVCCIAKFWTVCLCLPKMCEVFDHHRYKCNSFGYIKNKGLWESSACVWDI